MSVDINIKTTNNNKIIVEIIDLIEGVPRKLRWFLNAHTNRLLFRDRVF